MFGNSLWSKQPPAESQWPCHLAASLADFPVCPCVYIKMFRIPHFRNHLLAQSRPRLTRSIITVPSRTSVHPWRALALSKLPLPRAQSGIRQLSTTLSLQAQHTRFSSDKKSHGQWDPRTRIIVFIGAAGVVYYVAQYVVKPHRARVILSDPRVVWSKYRKLADGGS
jgi:hypothetical protein